MAILLVLAMGNTYAQPATPIPNPNWPLDSVVNSAVHKYTVAGDQNYSSPSTFIWTVKGGHFYYDSLAQNPVSPNPTDVQVTVNGDQNNITELYIKWDGFARPLDTGYVYVSEISATGCERSNDDAGKFQGMRIRVSAPPKVRFLQQEPTIACANIPTGVTIELEIDGMPPFDLDWSYDGQPRRSSFAIEDLVDSDMDGKVNNLTLTYIDDFFNTTVDITHNIQLIKASSGGVDGKILDNPLHQVFAFAQSEGPLISPTPTEVTVHNTHIYNLSNPGENVKEYYWEFYDKAGNLISESVNNQTAYPVKFDVVAGDYQLVSYYFDKDGCFSLADSLDIAVFDLPTIAFADSSKDVESCSALDLEANDAFEFTVEYKGATTYRFTYAILDYNDMEVYRETITYKSERVVPVVVQNNFINDELPDIDRRWKIKIIEGVNEEGNEITVVDGSSERIITIHPKPIINDDIDFAN